MQLQTENEKVGEKKMQNVQLGEKKSTRACNARAKTCDERGGEAQCDT